MPEKFSTVTVGGATFTTAWERRLHEPVCAQIERQYRQNPDHSIVHERCDDATCEICDRVFGDGLSCPDGVHSGSQCGRR